MNDLGSNVLIQCKWDDIEGVVTIYDWDEGEVSGDAEQLLHSAIDDPEWGLILAKTKRYAGTQSCHCCHNVLIQSKWDDRNIEGVVTIYDWDEGEVSGDAEQLMHSAIHDPEWGLILAKTTRYAGTQSCHCS